MVVSDYLNRIQYTGDLTPNYPLLQQLQKNHLLHIPFENLDIHYHTPIQLELHHLFQKIILSKRGGFCYELNTLFYHLLAQLGYQASLISARVFNSETNSYGMEFDHLAILVEMDEQNYLVDVGFGEFTFSPLHLQPGNIQHDPRGDFKFDKLVDDYWLVSKITDQVPVPQYKFTLKKRALAEFESMCYYHQTSPHSHFTQKRLITRPTLNGRITLAGNTLKIIEHTKPPIQKKFENHEFNTYVQTWFNITGLPQPPIL
jgi:N-hydroxyarylamine O-acetyltransferase